MIEPLLTYEEYARKKNMTVREVRTLVSKGILPHLDLGHRTKRLIESRAEKALLKREVREAA